jgi:hypothetical protein
VRLSENDAPCPQFTSHGASIMLHVEAIEAPWLASQWRARRRVKECVGPLTRPAATLASRRIARLHMIATLLRRRG